MNCKPGDWALVVGSERGVNTGKSVRCIRLLASEEHYLLEKYGAVWLVDRDMDIADVIGRSHAHPWAPDRFLMPIRPPAQAAETEFTAVSEDGNAT